MEKLWFCKHCNKNKDNNKKQCIKCLEKLYEDLKDILDKDLLDDILEDLF